MVQERIEIVATLIDNVTSATKNVTKSIETLSDGTEKVTQRVEGFNRKGNEINSTYTKTTTGLRRFKGEMLSLLFFGMGLNRVFGTYIKQVTEMLGINELFNQGMQLAILEALGPFLDHIYGLLGTFLDLNPVVQKFIGFATITGWGLGTILQNIGFIVLGLEGISVWLGVPYKMLFTHSGYSSLMKKLSIVGKLAAAGVSLWLVYQGIKDMNDKPVKSIGEFLTAAGIVGVTFLGAGAGGAAVIAVGLTLTLLGDEDLLVSFYKTVIKMGQFMTNTFSAVIKKMFGVELSPTETQYFANLRDSYRKAVEQLSIEQEGLSAFGFKQATIYKPVKTMEKYNEAVDKLLEQRKNGEIASETELQRAIQQLRDVDFASEYSYYTKFLELNKSEIYEQNNAENLKTLKSQETALSMISDYNTIGGIFSGIMDGMISDNARASKFNLLNIAQYVIDVTGELNSIPKNITTTHTIRSITERVVNYASSVFRQYGGPVARGNPYIVGEAGPELFVPNSNGSIVPNNKVGGQGINITQNITVTVSDKREFEGMIKSNNDRLVTDLRRLIEI